MKKVNLGNVRKKITSEYEKLNLLTLKNKEIQHLYNWYSKCYYFHDRRLNPADYGINGGHRNKRKGSVVNEETMFYSGVAAMIYNNVITFGGRLKFWKLFSASKTRTRWTSREIA